MDLRPNKTVLEGKVVSIRPEPDGWGAEIDLEVTGNFTPSSEDDFLQPQPGTTMHFFAADAERIHLGEKVRLVASLRGGPRGTRAVIESAEPAGA